MSKNKFEKENPPATIENRKESHLNLALESQNDLLDQRFYYEPMLSAHPDKKSTWEVPLGDKLLKYPIWISSMTGGTSNADEINRKLAHTAQKFGLGMGLGSCRPALDNNTLTEGFNLRPILGDSVPFYLNLGIAQVEQLLKKGEIYRVKDLRKKLNADGLIIHVNPLQEWLQPEGDLINNAPVDTIKKMLNEVDFPLIVKEVGQGFGKNSMRALMELPLAAIEFAANGGTNFSKLELFRNRQMNEYFQDLINVGHSAKEMTGFMNEILNQPDQKTLCKTVIISGGIKSFLDGYYAISTSGLPALYGQAAAFLKNARGTQEELDTFTENQIKGLLLARAFLKVK